MVERAENRNFKAKNCYFCKANLKVQMCELGTIAFKQENLEKQPANQKNL